MAKFLTTTQISAELESLIRSAENDVIIISPYLKVNQRLQDFIEDANRRRVRFTLIYGKQDIRPAEREWINQLTNTETGFVQNLHAKCYLNDATAIVTSMNLYEFSQQNNDEMGILVTSGADPDLFEDIYAEAMRLGRKAGVQWIERSLATVTELSGGTENKQAPSTELAGFCIRRGEPIKLDRAKPLCPRCFGEWAKFRNETYSEKYCHACGRQRDTTFAKPLCGRCYESSLP